MRNKADGNVVHNVEKEKRLKFKIFNREICVCALQSHNGLHKHDIRKKQRRNGENHDKFNRCRVI